jgi:hypothetical protein
MGVFFSCILAPRKLSLLSQLTIVGRISYYCQFDPYFLHRLTTNKTLTGEKPSRHHTVDFIRSESNCSSRLMFGVSYHSYENPDIDPSENDLSYHFKTTANN